MIVNTAPSWQCSSVSNLGQLFNDLALNKLNHN
jgi:hypothetical protein